MSNVDQIKVIQKKNTIVIALEENASIKKLTYLYIDYVLEKMGNNKVHAARILGIDRRTIQRLIRRGYVSGRKPSSPPMALEIGAQATG